jgi:hypothetical protein
MRFPVQQLLNERAWMLSYMYITLLAYVSLCKVKSPVTGPVWPRGFQIFMTFNAYRWWDRHPHAPGPFTPGMFLVLIFFRGWVDPRAIVQSEGIMSLKNPVTPPGIDSGTVRLVVQRLNHYATPGPMLIYVVLWKHRRLKFD